MANQISVITRPLSETSNAEIWPSLKIAIASSSGFQRWQLENPIADYDQDNNNSIDHRVSRYLRETLETLAY